MIDVNVEPRKPQDVAMAEGKESKPGDPEEEPSTEQGASRDSISELARLAANKGQMKTGNRASVFEGDGKVDEKEGEKEPPSPASRSGSSPVIGGVRVMPEANEELQKIL